MRQVDALLKRGLRTAYRAVWGGHALASLFTSGGGAEPRLFYGGARSGNMGGPLVKVKRMQMHFPEHRFDFNAIYLLSNAPYLPALALALHKARRIPIVYNQNGVYYPAWFAGDCDAENRRMALAYHRADHVFYQSRFCKEAADRFLGERVGPGEILYNAVDTTWFKPSNEPRPQRPFTFLISGKIGLHLYYRLESTIAGLAAARGSGLAARLTIAGFVDPEARKRAETLAHQLGIAEALCFTGPYSQEDAPALIAAADAYVMTKHNDPCPNAVLEALACGLPVVYSATGGVPELVGDEAGVAVQCQKGWDGPHVPDPAAIGAAMIRVAASRDVMSDIARARAVERFDITHWIGRHREVFIQLLEARR